MWSFEGTKTLCAVCSKAIGPLLSLLLKAFYPDPGAISQKVGYKLGAELEATKERNGYISPLQKQDFLAGLLLLLSRGKWWSSLGGPQPQQQHLLLRGLLAQFLWKHVLAFAD